MDAAPPPPPPDTDPRPLGGTARTRLRRHGERAVIEREALYALLDACPIVHVGTPRPLVLPMAFGRRGDRLYLHGAASNALLASALESPHGVCVVATRVDGLVCARSAFHHSMNYRSAVIFGSLVEVDEAERADALTAILEHALPGRAAECRPPSDAESKATRIVAIDLAEASVKARSGPPKDADGDLSMLHWAGVLPLVERASQAIAESPAGGSSPPPSIVRAALARAPALEGELAFGSFVLSGDPRRLAFEKVLTWLRDDTYWASDLDAGRLLRAIQGSYCAGVYSAAGEQVAFARVVTDGETFGWLCDVYVDEQARGRGVGTAIVRYLVDRPEFARFRRWMLGTRDAHGVYAPLGFRDVPTGRFMQKGAPCG